VLFGKKDAANSSLSKKISSKIIDWLNREEPSDDIPLCDFDRVRYEIRPCDVLLIEGHSRISEIIKLVTQSSWSHAILYIGRLSDIENPLLRQRVKEFMTCDENEQMVIEGVLGRGTIISPLSSYEKAHIRICRPQGISRQDSQKVIGFSIGRLGVEYDIRHSFDLFRFLLPWGILPRRWRSSLFKQNAGEPTRDICSSLLAEAFGSVRFPILPLVKQNEVEGIQFVQRNTRLYTPRDFDYSPYFEIIKYPIFELSERALYRHLPWVESASYGNVPVAEPLEKHKDK
jgi:hypothetical protein